MIDTLDPIALDELVADAALLTRVDRKYVLPRTLAEQVIAELPAHTRVLTIDGQRQFGYASWYFDTPDLISYRAAAQGRRRRFKLRTRAYLDAQLAFLEMKTRGARNTTVKERIRYDFTDRDRLTAAGRDYAADGLLAIGVHADLPLQHVLTTRYRRTTLLAPDNGGRATIDVDLGWEDAAGKCLHLPDLAIIETKSGARTGIIDRLLWRHGIRPARISKYGTGLAALHPELPSNKWARVLRTQFRPHTLAA